MWRTGSCLAALAALAGCGGAVHAPRPAPRVRPAVRVHAAVRHTVPVALRGAAARRAAIPILMYHVVSAAPPGAPYPQLWVSAPEFAREMRALRARGYHAITLAAAVRAWRHGGPLPRRPVVLSFDDGYRSDFTHARPVLRRLGWPGVLNLALNNLRRGDITPAEVRALIRSGWEIDSHTLTHPDLTTLPAAALRHELAGSRAEIRRRFGQPADFFCYPYGRYNAAVVAAVRAAGYRAALTTEGGLGVAQDLYALRRVRVSGRTPPALLRRR
jgi:peptidoglycan/xylan/chitin deacetylase (PgdA/CDA1 family)